MKRGIIHDHYLRRFDHRNETLFQPNLEHTPILEPTTVKGAISCRVIPFDEKPDTNRAFKMKFRLLLDLSLDFVNFSSSFPIAFRSACKFGKHSQAQDFLISSHNLSIGFTNDV